jgi:glycosyltransferase involved in cell wall biosynthesis
VPNTKISLITACYNAEAHIGRCIESVIAQNYSNLEYIVIDGGSTDQTLSVIKRYENYITKIVSEPDKGVYDAMNKGILLATGDVVGTLNSDDFFAADDVLTTIGEVFSQSDAQIIFGDLDYVNFNETIIRKWRTKKYIKGIYNWGWMPPHPTFYCKRLLFDEFGLYKLDYGTAADYELMLRFMHKTNLNTFYINNVLVKMQCGGMSNKYPISRVRAWKNDLKAMRNNDVRFPLLSLIVKLVRKIKQFL